MDKLLFCRQVQELVLETGIRYDMMINKLKENHLYNSEDSINLIIRNLVHMCFIRPKNISFISEFMCEIFKDKNISEDQILEILVDAYEQRDNIHGRMSPSVPMFLLHCINYLGIPHEKLIDELDDVFSEEVCGEEDNFVLFIYLGPVMEEKRKELFDDIYQRYIYLRPELERDISNIKANNWERFYIMRNNNGLPDSLGHTIRSDNIVKLKFSIDDKSFHYDQQVKSSIYEPSVFIEDVPPIIAYAAFNGSFFMVKAALASMGTKAAKIKKKSIYAKYAIAGGNLEIVQFLKENGFNFEGSIDIAIKYQRKDILNWLITNIYDNKDIFENYLVLSLENYNYDFFIEATRKLSNLSIPNEDDDSILHVAVRKSIFPAVEYLLSLDNFDINSSGSNGSTALSIAAETNDTEIANLLLSRTDIDVNKCDDDGVTPLGMTASCGCASVARLLLSRSDVDVNRKDSSGSTPAHTAILNDNLDVAEMIISSESCDVDIRDSEDISVFSLTAVQLNLDLLKLAIGKTKSINRADSNGMAAIHHAASNSIEFLKLIVEYGGDPSLVDMGGKTPLHHASISGNANCISYLLSLSSVDPNKKDKEGYTALHYAINKGAIEPIKNLISNERVDINIKVNNNTSPLLLAATRMNEECVELLLQRKDLEYESAYNFIKKMKSESSKRITKMIENIKQNEANNN